VTRSTAIRWVASGPAVGQRLDRLAGGQAHDPGDEPSQTAEVGMRHPPAREHPAVGRRREVIGAERQRVAAQASVAGALEEHQHALAAGEPRRAEDLHDPSVDLSPGHGDHHLAAVEAAAQASLDVEGDLGDDAAVAERHRVHPTDGADHDQR
jgi:hypothetical protein